MTAEAGRQQAQGAAPAAVASTRLGLIYFAPVAAHDWREVDDTLIALHVDCDWRPDESGLVAVAKTPQATIYRLR